jgi:NAD(P)-dependent dehydrogenase (short-subunit alcohol dehydrogenase family)
MSSVLITGASKGIGRAIAVELTRRGHRVVASARNPDTLSDLDVDPRLALDVTDTLPDDPYAALLEHHGGRDQVLTPDDVAAAVADATAVSKLPLRVPIGPAAEKILAARRAAPDDVPFAL